MKHRKKFVELDESLHDRDSFDCGEEELNTFLKTQASRGMRAAISKTLVLPAPTPLPNTKYPICAFYTVTPSMISRETLPPKLAKSLPRYPVPVFLLAQMAVHNEYQKQGLGKVTLIQALKYLGKASAHMPAYAVVVDCLNKKAESFYLKYGFTLLCTHEGRSRMFLPMSSVIEIQ